VDLTANGPLPGGAGAGAGPEINPAMIETNNPGATIRFNLNVNNTSGVPDTYNMSVTNSLPAGWVVQFKNSGGTVIANTGIVPANSNILVYADVTVPADELFYSALSPTTGATDILHGRATVNSVHAITIKPNGAGQIPAGGTAVYSHQLCNNGNISESITLSASDSVVSPAWGNVLYLDSNGNSVFDTNDTVVAAAVTVPAGTCTNIFVKAIAPAGATIGSQNTTTLSGATAGNTATASATDVSTVVDSSLTVLKEQGLDADCSGGTVTFGATPISAGAVSGSCVRYRITATNNGITTNTDVHVYDATPAFTTYLAGGGVAPASVSPGIGVTAPVSGNAGTLDFNIGTLMPGQSATCTFQVRISP
jgi:uncharacterized repeat protein (TIGR01451 family)